MARYFYNLCVAFDQLANTICAGYPASNYVRSVNGVTTNVSGITLNGYVLTIG